MYMSVRIYQNTCLQGMHDVYVSATIYTKDVYERSISADVPEKNATKTCVSVRIATNDELLKFALYIISEFHL
jgi:hypothetical protein